MRVKSFASILLVILTVTAQAQQAVPAAVATAYNAIKESDLQADLTFFASDALQGRMSLQTGDEVGIQWIASEFAKAGLKPAAGGSYLQPVPLIEYRPDRAQSYVALKRGSTQKQWQFPEAYGAFPKDVDITAEVVFAGFGITAPGLGYDDYHGIDTRGKIVLDVT